MNMLERKFITSLFVIFSCIGAFGQDAIKVGGGMTISSMSTNQDFDLFEKNVLSFYPYVGADWLCHKYFYMSAALLAINA